MAKAEPPKTIDEYIARFPAPVRAILEKVRTTIRTAAPEATETISYQMPEGHVTHQPAFFVGK